MIGSELHTGATIKPRGEKPLNHSVGRGKWQSLQITFMCNKGAKHVDATPD
jgi:hypothetical protein